MPDFAAGDLLGRFVVMEDPHQRVRLHLAERCAVAADMLVQLAEELAEPFQILRRDLLIAEEQDEMFGDRVVDFLHFEVAERPGEVELGDLRADIGRDWLDANRSVRQGALLLILAVATFVR